MLEKIFYRMALGSLAGLVILLLVFSLIDDSRIDRLAANYRESEQNYVELAKLSLQNGNSVITNANSIHKNASTLLRQADFIAETKTKEPMYERAINQIATDLYKLIEELERIFQPSQQNKIQSMR